MLESMNYDWISVQIKNERSKTISPFNYWFWPKRKMWGIKEFDAIVWKLWEIISL
jgi:hypothetical protein